nr:LRP16 family protein [Cryptococcus depauperatus CBS 7855]
MSLSLFNRVFSFKRLYASQTQSRMVTTTAQDIPSLQELWQQGVLKPLASDFSQDSGINRRVSIWRGDITKLKADMIVNAANSSLLGGGGVDGAIHSAAGPRLLRECERLGGAKTGETKVTMGYNLPSVRVAHTVGPIYARYEPKEAERLLKSCYDSCLSLCREHGGGVIGFSSISTGVYGYPIREATHVALSATRAFLEKDTSISRVIYVVFSQRDQDVYQELAPIYFPGS